MSGKRSIGLLRLAARRPVEALDRLAGQIDIRRVASERRDAAGAFTADVDWSGRLHLTLGCGACREEEEFQSIWDDLDVSAGGLVVDGHDSDRAIGRAVWCVIRHSRAKRVVETGVARGVSSRIILEALKSCPESRLWSVDLPLLAEEWADIVGTAVPNRLTSQWIYVRGSAKRALPRLLDGIGPIDMFVQDSRSTLAAASFEFETAWKALKPGGILIANSIDRSLAFAHFVQRAQPVFCIAAPFERKSGLFGIARKEGGSP